MVDLSKLEIGRTGSVQVSVTPDKLATAVGSGAAEVFASPMLVAAMEAACVDCVEALLPDGHQSLGVALDIVHTAPTPPGLTVTATATLVSIDGRKLSFRLDAHDGVEQIGSGGHTRIVVDRRRFEAKLSSKAMQR